MLSKIDEKQIDRLYNLLHKAGTTDPDTAAALRWAIFTLEQGLQAPQSLHDNLTRKDYLEIWGYLEILKTEFEAKAKAAAQRGDDIGDKLTGDHLRQAESVRSMQKKVNERAMNMSD